MQPAAVGVTNGELFDRHQNILVESTYTCPVNPDS